MKKLIYVSVETTYFRYSHKSFIWEKLAQIQIDNKCKCDWFHFGEHERFEVYVYLLFLSLAFICRHVYCRKENSNSIHKHPLKISSSQFNSCKQKVIKIFCIVPVSSHMFYCIVTVWNQTKLWGIRTGVSLHKRLKQLRTSFIFSEVGFGERKCALDQMIWLLLNFYLKFSWNYPKRKQAFIQSVRKNLNGVRNFIKVIENK